MSKLHPTAYIGYLPFHLKWAEADFSPRAWRTCLGSLIITILVRVWWQLLPLICSYLVIATSDNTLSFPGYTLCQLGCCCFVLLENGLFRSIAHLCFSSFEHFSLWNSYIPWILTLYKSLVWKHFLPPMHCFYLVSSLFIEPFLWYELFM